MLDLELEHLHEMIDDNPAAEFIPVRREVLISLLDALADWQSVFGHLSEDPDEAWGIVRARLEELEEAQATIKAMENGDAFEELSL